LLFIIQVPVDKDFVHKSIETDKQRSAKGIIHGYGWKSELKANMYKKRWLGEIKHESVGQRLEDTHRLKTKKLLRCKKSNKAIRKTRIFHNTLDEMKKSY